MSVSVQRSIQKGISDFSFIIGAGLQYGGAFGLLVMAAVGTVAIDIVILAAAEKNHDHFLTGFVLGSMFSRGDVDFRPLLIASPITTVIAIALSFALGVPGVGVGLLVGWGTAATLLGLGMGLEALSKELDPDAEDGCCYYAPGMGM